MTIKHNQKTQYALGIDIGGSSVKIALVDCTSGTIISPVIPIILPKPSTPDNILKLIDDQGKKIMWEGALGIGFPGVIKNGRTMTAPHLDVSWKNFDFLSSLISLPFSSVTLVNDTDAAGIAEMKYGAGSKSATALNGTVLLLTFGTGIGSSLFRDGLLVPNTEFGHIQLNGTDAEKTAAVSIRSSLQLDWQTYAARMNIYVEAVIKLLSPDLIIIGGGISDNFNLFSSYLTTTVPIAAATFGNQAGIIGAALKVYQKI